MYFCTLQRNIELSRETMTTQRDIEEIKARIKSRQDSFEGSIKLQTQALETKTQVEKILVRALDCCLLSAVCV
jgi:hypothetical protein